jgi:hypothetical protein
VDCQVEEGDHHHQGIGGVGCIGDVCHCPLLERGGDAPIPDRGWVLGSAEQL